MPYRRRYRSRRNMGQVIQSYKKVLNFAPASIPVGNNGYTLTTGVDSTAAGQTSPTDGNIPTGAVVKFIEIQFCIQNLVSIAMFTNLSIQHIRSGQGAIGAIVVGGDPQRNQVHWQMMKSVGKEQNTNFVIRFKIPAKFQRVREGDRWIFQTYTDQISTQAVQVIYKFYR